MTTARLAVLVALLAGCRGCAGGDAPGSGDLPPLYPIRERTHAAADTGRELVVAFADGTVMVIPKESNSPARVLVRLRGRQVREIAVLGERIALLHYGLDADGFRIIPPGRLDVHTLAGGEAWTLGGEVDTMAYLAADGAGLLLLESPPRGTRLRRFDGEALTEQAIELPNEGGGFGLAARDGAAIIHLHSYGAASDSLFLVRGVEVARIGGGALDVSGLFATPGGFVVLSSTATGARTPRGEAYFEHPATFGRLDLSSGTVRPFDVRPVQNGQDPAVGPTHACIVEYFPERLSVENRDVLLVALGDRPAPPRVVIARVASAKCLAVDAEAAYVAVGDRGIVRVPLAP